MNATCPIPGVQARAILRKFKQAFRPHTDGKGHPAHVSLRYSGGRPHRLLVATACDRRDVMPSQSCNMSDEPLYRQIEAKCHMPCSLAPNLTTGAKLLGGVPRQ